MSVRARSRARAHEQPPILYIVLSQRVHVGVHYPSDVLVGSAWGLATGHLYATSLLPRLLALFGATGGAAALTSAAKLLGALSIPGLVRLPWPIAHATPMRMLRPCACCA